MAGIVYLLTNEAMQPLEQVPEIGHKQDDV